MNDRHPLDDAIDRTVRDMTHVAADDDGVARVMARLRETDARDSSASKGTRWMLTPRVAWCSVLALLLMALLSRYSWHPMRRDAEAPRVVAVTAPPQSSTPSSTPSTSSLPSLAAREFPTAVAAAPSTTRATTAARDARPELAPLESDITLASITPAPLGDAPAIDVAPLMTTALTVDEIPVASIDMPPVSPEQQK